MPRTHSKLIGRATDSFTPSIEDMGIKKACAGLVHPQAGCGGTLNKDWRTPRVQVMISKRKSSALFAHR